MIPPMRDLREFHDPDLHLPINGTTYTVKCPTASEGLRLKQWSLNDAGEGLTRDKELEAIAMLLHADYDPETNNLSGGLWDEMDTNGVPYVEMEHVGYTALAHFAYGENFGEFWWENRLGKANDPLNPELVYMWAAQQQANQAEPEPTPPKPTRKRTRKTTS